MIAKRISTIVIASICATFLFLIGSFGIQKWGPMERFRNVGVVIGMTFLGGGSIIGSYEDVKASAKTWALVWTLLINPGLIVGLAIGLARKNWLSALGLTLSSVIVGSIASKFLINALFSSLAAHGFQSNPYPQIENGFYVGWQILVTGAIPMGITGALLGSWTPIGTKRQPANHLLDRPAAR